MRRALILAALLLLAAPAAAAAHRQSAHELEANMDRQGYATPGSPFWIAAGNDGYATNTRYTIFFSYRRHGYDEWRAFDVYTAHTGRGCHNGWGDCGHVVLGVVRR